MPPNPASFFGFNLPTFKKLLILLEPRLLYYRRKEESDVGPMFFFQLLKFFFYCIFCPLPFSPLIPPPHHQQSPHSMSSFSFLLNPSTPYPSLQMSSCSLSSLSLFCLLGLFVHRFHIMSEIIWYLSFSDQLISLSVTSPGPPILSQRVKLSSFLHLSSIPLCKYPIVVCSKY